MAKKYNGHDSYTAWNISLWINNDEGLYRMALACVRKSRRNRDKAAVMMLEWLKECGIEKTPDGAKYTKTSIRKAMVGM